MTATAHAVIGTIIAAKVGNPAVGIPLAIVSHIAADLFPHWDTATNIDTKGKKRVIAETILDVILGFVISYALINLFFSKANLPYALMMILISQGLDWLTMPYYFFNINFPLFRWAYRFQKLFNNSLNAPWGVINQIAIIMLLVALAKLF